MANPIWHNIHSEFRLNGVSCKMEILRQVADGLQKKGEPFEKAIGGFLSDWVSDAPTLAVQTSGSTGEPKTIVLKKEQMINSAKATGEYFDLQPKKKSTFMFAVHRYCW